MRLLKRNEEKKTNSCNVYIAARRTRILWEHLDEKKEWRKYTPAKYLMCTDDFGRDRPFSIALLFYFSIQQLQKEKKNKKTRNKMKKSIKGDRQSLIKSRNRKQSIGTSVCNYQLPLTRFVTVAQNNGWRCNWNIEMSEVERRMAEAWWITTN